MNILIIYQSRGGHTRSAAAAIAETCRSKGHTAHLKSVVEVQKKDIEQADAVFIGTWVQGFILFGVKPAEAELWVPALPALSGKAVGIFCTYAFNPRSSLQKLATMLEARGAHIVGRQAFQRGDLQSGLTAFVDGVLHDAERAYA